MEPARVHGRRWFVHERGFADRFFAGVADGHGGRAGSAFLREQLFDSLNTYVSGVSASAPAPAPDGTPGGGYLADALDRGFTATDAKLIDHVASLGEPECWSGSTCTVALVREDRVVCANVGDSRALLVRTGRGSMKGIELSSDHRPVGSCKTGRQELDRVVRAGGWSVGGRVCGILAVSAPSAITSSKEDGSICWRIFPGNLWRRKPRWIRPR